MEKIVETIPYERTKAYDHTAAYFPGKKVCMFDIETTGLSPMNSFTYIIGVNIKVGDDWQIIQLFNDDGRSEPEMINAFFDIISDYDVLVEFNGDRFDIPYIEKRMNVITNKLHVRFENGFNKITSFDLMKCIKPYKYALGLPNIKQKTIEKYLGIDRVDTFNGGQLIDVYLNFVTTGDKKSRELVLRHNRDDMEGMLFLGSVQAIDMMKMGKVSIERFGVKEIAGKLFFVIDLKLESSLGRNISTSSYGAALDAEEDYVCLKVPIYTGSLNYYLGTKEKDGVVKKEGYFVTALNNYDGSIALYKDTARAKSGYVMLDDTFLGNMELILEYARHMIKEIMLYKGK